METFRTLNHRVVRTQKTSQRRRKKYLKGQTSLTGNEIYNRGTDLTEQWTAFTKSLLGRHPALI